MDEKAWCVCGHEMEPVRPGKFQKAGCCEKYDTLFELAGAFIDAWDDDYCDDVTWENMVKTTRDNLSNYLQNND